MILLQRQPDYLLTAQVPHGPLAACRREAVAPNWVDSQLVTPDDGGAAQTRARWAISQDAFVVAYGGNIGVAAGLETVIESFRYLADIDNLYLVIAGEGSNLGHCRELAMAIASERVRFHTPWPQEETSAVLAAADLLMLPTQGAQSLVSVPSKLITYLLAARPIIATACAESDLAATIDRAGCGWVVPPDEPQRLAAKIREVTRLPAVERARRGRAGRAFALENLTAEVCVPRVVAVLEQAARQALG